MATYHRYFLWERPYGLAYDVTLLELCERATRVSTAESAVDCSRYQLTPRPP